MSENHDHGSHEGHNHASGSTARSKLVVALVLTGTFLFVEAIAGWLSGSLALLSDAGHMLTDAGALGLALFAQVLASRVRTGARTFGFRRAEILAALVNGTVLGVGAVWVIVAAIQRMDAPVEISGLPMMAVAAGGLVVNLLSAWVLSRGEASNANVRAALAHVLADLAGSVAALVAGALILWRGWLWADAAASIAISVLIIWGAWRLVRESVHVLMEGTPKGLAVDALEATILGTAGVASLHDLHVWSITDGVPMVTVHVVLDRNAHGTVVAREVGARVQAAHGIEHVTVQPDAPEPPLIPLEALWKR